MAQDYVVPREASEGSPDRSHLIMVLPTEADDLTPESFTVEQILEAIIAGDLPDDISGVTPEYAETNSDTDADWHETQTEDDIWIRLAIGDPAVRTPGIPLTATTATQATSTEIDEATVTEVRSFSPSQLPEVVQDHETYPWAHSVPAFYREGLPDPGIFSFKFETVSDVRYLTFTSLGEGTHTYLYFEELERHDEFAVVTADTKTELCRGEIDDDFDTTLNRLAIVGLKETITALTEDEEYYLEFSRSIPDVGLTERETEDKVVSGVEDWALKKIRSTEGSQDLIDYISETPIPLDKRYLNLPIVWQDEFTDVAFFEDTSLAAASTDLQISIATISSEFYLQVVSTSTEDIATLEATKQFDLIGIYDNVDAAFTAFLIAEADWDSTNGLKVNVIWEDLDPTDTYTLRQTRQLTDDYIENLIESADQWLEHFHLAYTSDFDGITGERWGRVSGDTAIEMHPGDDKKNVIAALTNGSKIQVRNINGTVRNTFTLDADAPDIDSDGNFELSGAWETSPPNFISSTNYSLFFTVSRLHSVATDGTTIDGKGSGDDPIGVKEGGLDDTHLSAALTLAKQANVREKIDIKTDAFTKDVIASNVSNVGDVVTLTVSPEYPILKHGDSFRFKPKATNTGNIVVRITGQSVNHSITKSNGDHFAASEFPIDRKITIVFNIDDGHFFADFESATTATGTDVAVQDDGTEVDAAAEHVNFTGDGVTVTVDGEGVAVAIPGGTTTTGTGTDVAVQDDGTQVDAAPEHVNFTGDGVTVTVDGEGVAVAIPGGTTTTGTGTDVAVQDDGAEIDAAPEHVNFTGDGVTVTVDGEGVAVAIPGGGTTATEDEQRAEKVKLQGISTDITRDSRSAAIATATTDSIIVEYGSGVAQLVSIATSGSDIITIEKGGIYLVSWKGVIDSTTDRAYPGLEIYNSSDTPGTDAALAIVETNYKRWNADNQNVYGEVQLIIDSDDTDIKLYAISVDTGGTALPAFTLDTDSEISFKRVGIKGRCGWRCNYCR